MSIKSTVTLTRKEAEDMFIEFRVNKMRKRLDRQIKRELEGYDDRQLGDALDVMTDDIFSNYQVCDDNQEEECDNLK